MKVLLVAVACLVFLYAHAAQDTYPAVYTIFQTKCAQSGCHSHLDAAGSLDLEGNGLNLTQRMQDVYSKLYFMDSYNSYCVNHNYKLVYPGNPYASTLFRKINDELSPDVVLNPAEGLPCPQDTTTVGVEQIELIRQWVLYGAPPTGEVVDPSLIHDYYTNGGIPSVANPPLAPDSTQGFQLHFGPVFLSPGDEFDLMNLMDTHIPQSMEVNRIDIAMGDFAHHIILSDVPDTVNLQNSDYGMQPLDFSVAAHQICTAMDPVNYQLPQGTAFLFSQNTKMYINAHYIDFSIDKATACELYFNFYTQPVGTAKQIMYSALWPDKNLNIPPNGDTTVVTESSTSIVDDSVPIYMWEMNSHTHKAGVDFDVYHRMPNGTKGTEIYDASCDGGTPGCQFPFYDYQHPPLMYFDPMSKIMLNEGIIFEAKYVNNTGSPLHWGPSLDDEMMGVNLMYVYDTTGLNQIEDTTGNSAVKPVNDGSTLRIYPNPVQNHAVIELGDITYGAKSNFCLYDLMGRMVKELPIGNRKRITLNVEGLSAGVYVYQIINSGQTLTSGKIAVQ